MGAIYANKDYVQFGYKEHQACNYCQEECQTKEHLIRECEYVQTLWDEIGKGLLGRNISMKEKIIGSTDSATDFVIFKAAKYILQCNFHNKPMAYEELKRMLINFMAVEQEIGNKKGWDNGRREWWKYVT